MEFAGADGHFWDVHDALYENQEELGLPLYLDLAEVLNLPQKALREALETRAFRAKVRSDFMGGLKSGVNGTPTFFINGKRHDGASDFDSLAGAIAAELALLKRHRALTTEKALRWGITRRHLLGAAGLTGLSLLAKPAWAQAVLDALPSHGQALTQPPEIRSENGVLNATLSAAPARVAACRVRFPRSCL